MTSELGQWCCFGVSNVNLEHFTPSCWIISTTNFEQVNVCRASASSWQLFIAMLYCQETYLQLCYYIAYPCQDGAWNWV